MTEQDIRDLRSPRSYLSFSLEDIRSAGEVSDLEDYQSFKTSDTKNSKLSFYKIGEANSLESQRRSFGNLYKSVKEKQAIIKNLESRVDVLSTENSMLKQKMKQRSTQKGQKQNNVYHFETTAQLKHLEAMIRQKQLIIQNQQSKSQHEVNLLYSSLSARLKKKQIQCYNYSKTLKQQKIQSQQLSSQLKFLKQDVLKLKQLNAHLLSSNNHILSECQNLKTELQHLETHKLRLKYCQNQMLFVNQCFRKQKQTTLKLQIQAHQLISLNSELQHKLTSILDQNDLNKTVLGLQTQLQEIQHKSIIEIESLNVRKKVNERLLYEQNQSSVRSKLSKLNEQYRNKMY